MSSLVLDSIDGEREGLTKGKTGELGRRQAALLSNTLIPFQGSPQEREPARWHHSSSDACRQQVRDLQGLALASAVVQSKQDTEHG